MNRVISPLKANIAAAVVLGLFLGFVSRDANSLERVLQSPFTCFVWMTVLFMATIYPIPRTRGRSPINLVPAIILAAICVFGAAAACWFSVLSRFVANTTHRWKPVSLATWKVSQAVVSVGIAGWFYEVMGGHIQDDVFGSTTQILLIFGTGVLYSALDEGLTGLSRILQLQRSSRALRTRWLKDKILHGSGVLSLGGIVLWTHTQFGAQGVALFVLPMLLARYLNQNASAMRKSYRDTIRTLMSSIDGGDPFSRGHSYRISKISVTVARHLGLPDREIERIELAALLQDVGRTAIHHDLASKQGKLTDEEHSILRAHPKIGSELIRDFGFDDDAAGIVLTHHEQPDGKGYPLGLSGEEIPMGSRIIMVVAAFDAMTSDRPYRRGLAPEAAFEELLSHGGTQFFSEVVEALVALYSTNELFSEFDKDELESYEAGESNSRAVVEFLRRTGSHSVPEKLGVSEDIPQEENGVPIIDFPDLSNHHLEFTDEFDLEDGFVLEVGAVSDVGCSRDNNEDTFGVFPGPHLEHGVLLVVADGMGGAAAGEVASQLAVETIEKTFFDLVSGSTEDALRKSVEVAHKAILTRAQNDQELDGMGTTCTSVVIKGNKLVIGHIGDSRAYLVSNGEINLLTRDHTLAAELSQMANGTDVAPAGTKNVLTRSLGNGQEAQVEMSNESIVLMDGDQLVLCSDGLSNLIDDDEIARMVSEDGPMAASRRMVQCARDRGGPDNITVEVACFKKSS